MAPIRSLRHQLSTGATTARLLVEMSLAAIEDPAGEGSRAFLSVAADRARRVADEIDATRASGGAVPPLAGIPVAVKDLCDVEGEVTTAGSTILANRAPATAHAPVVARLIAAGCIVVGRTNMTEFAYSGLGLNAHYDTPRSPWDRSTGRIPGGSSSGTAVAVADGMVAAGLGTDTGGSCRIPAAFCRIVGYKPTARRVPLDGLIPLSPSLDSVGPLGTTVDCCVSLDDVFAGGNGVVAETRPEPTSLSLGALHHLVLDDMSPEVATAYEAALTRLSSAGISVTDVDAPELTELPHIHRQGGLAASEAYAWHQELLASHGDDYDQRVRRRIEPGGQQLASHYIEVLNHRRRLIEVMDRRQGGLDAFVLPTVPVLPPTMQSFADDPDHYGQQNILCLRNTSVGNFLDGCAISVPVTTIDQPPVGLMLMSRSMDDDRLLRTARTVEAVLGLGEGRVNAGGVA